MKEVCGSMQAVVYTAPGEFHLQSHPRPVLQADTDAIVRVTLSSICTSDLHIRHGSVPKARQGIVVGHEMVGVVEQIGGAVRHLHVGDRVAVNVETFCGSCFFCKRGWVNNCTDPDGGWALGCRIDGGQAEFVRVPHADQGLTPIPDEVSDEQALFTGDILSTGYWSAQISDIHPGDTVVLLGAGPTGLCALQCCCLYDPAHLIVVDPIPARRALALQMGATAALDPSEDLQSYIGALTEGRGADVVIEAAGGPETFEMSWQIARPNATVCIVALYDRPQVLPLPEMYGKNLTFKTGGVDACHCGEILSLIAQGKIDVTPLITHRYPLSKAEEAYDLFSSRGEGVMKIALYPG